MSAIVIDVPPETYKRLQEHARRVGKTPEVLTRELLEAALQAREQVRPSSVREALQATGQVQPLSDTLRRKIIPGVTLEEVRLALTQAGGSSFGAIILEQRGPKQ